MSFGFGFGLPSWQTLSGGFTPASLFTGGEQGCWYEPSPTNGTLFQDAAGTTPVTAVEQFVGLMLDKRVPVAQTGYYSGVFDGNGDYLVTPSNNAFAMGTGDFTWEAWIYIVVGANYKQIFSTRPDFGAFTTAASLSINPNDGLSFYSNGFIVNYTASIGVSQWVHVAVSRSGTNLRVFANGTQVGATATNSQNFTSNTFSIGAHNDGSEPFNGYISNVRVIKGTALYTANFTPSTTPLAAISGTSLLTCQNATFIDNSGNNFTITVNGDAKTGARNPFGNHATSTGTKRPKLAARYNLLTYSEQFDNAAWSKDNATITTNAAVAPNGTTTADLFVENASTALHRFNNTSVTNIGTTVFVASLYIKAGTANYAYLDAYAGTPVGTIGINLLDGTPLTITGVPAATNYTITNVGNGWYRVSITFTSSSPTGNGFFAGTASSAGSRQTTGSGNILIWGADLRPASQATGLIGPTYQRVVDAATYDAVGFLPYLEFNGLSWSMSTNSIDFSAVPTDKMTVWAGVRKLSDALRGDVIELSTSTDANNGTFVLPAPNTTTTNRFAWVSKGTLLAISNASGSAYNAPTTNILTGIGDISGDVSTLRINGVQAATDASDQGSGNYGNYPLFIGARNNSGNFFNGWMYSLTVRGAQSSASEISAMESWVAGKTGVSL